MALRKISQVEERVRARGGLDPCSLAARYPNLWEHLTALAYPDQTARVPSSVSVFLDAGCLKACLKDKDNGLVAFVTADSLTGLLEALEAGLAEESLDWRVDGYGAKKKR